MTVENKHKVLFITSRSDIGGGPQHLFDLCNKNKFVECYIAAPDTEPFGSKFKTIASEFIELRHRSFSIIKLFEILLFCRERNIKIIHSHGRGAGIYGRLLALMGLKNIHTFHGIHRESSLIGEIKLYLDKFLSLLSEKNICVSNDERELAIRYGCTKKEDVFVIENGVDIEAINLAYKSYDKNWLRDKYGFSENDIVFGFLSRLNYQKGIDEFLLNEIDSLPNNYKFIFAGKGEERRSLEELIDRKKLKDRVFLYGETRHPIKFLKGIDIYFSCSRWEGLPISVLEALSVGKPCVLSDVVGHKDIDQNYNAICLYKNNLKLKISETLRNMSVLGEKSKKLAEEKYSVENVKKRTNQVYKLIGNL